MSGFGIYLAEIAMDLKSVLKACGGIVMMISAISTFALFGQLYDGDWRARSTARFACVAVLIGALLIIFGFLFPTPKGALALFP